MLKSVDEMVAKAVLKKELVTKQEMNECIAIYTAQESAKLIDILVEKGYVSRFQKEEMEMELEDKIKMLLPGDLVPCYNCNHLFNTSLLKSEKRRIRCGKCGIILTQKVNKTRVPTTNISIDPDHEVQEVFPISEPQMESADDFEIEDYKIISCLGEDYLGKTYQATQNDKLYSIKVIPKRLINDGDYISYLSKSIEKYSSLDIPNTPKTFGLQFYKSIAYIIYEHVEGDSLFKIFERNTSISLEESIKIIARTVKILRFASEQGFTHGNICPSNIIISNKNNKPALINFGVNNKVVDNALFLVDKYEEVPFYLAPEHIGPQKKFDFRTDIYHLGLVFYTLLARKPLFEGVSPYEIIKYSNNINLEELYDLNPEVNDDIISILSKMLAPIPTDRYQSYKELLWHLQNPERVNKNIAITDIGEDIFEQQTEIFAEKKKIEIPKVAPVKREKVKKEKEKEKEKIREREVEKEPVELSDRLRKKRMASRLKKETHPIRNTFVILLVLAAISYFVYDYITAQQRKDIAENTYKQIEKAYNEIKESSFEPDKWVEIKESSKNYIETYKDQKFYVDNAKSIISAIDDKIKQYVYKKFDEISTSVKNFNEQNYFMASFAKLEEMPESLLVADIKARLNTLRSETIQAAQKKYEDAVKKKEELVISYSTNTNLAQQAYLEKAYNEIKRSLEIIIQEYPKNTRMIFDEINILTINAQKHLDDMTEKRNAFINNSRKKTQTELIERIKNINSEITNAYQKMEYQKAMEFCNSTRKKDPSKENIIKEMYTLLFSLNKAKALLIQNFSRPKESIAVLYNGRSYQLKEMSEYTVVADSLNLTWNQCPKLLLQQLILKTSTMQSTSAQELFCLSLLAKEIDDYLLYQRLLEVSIIRNYPEAKEYSTRETERITEMLPELLSSLEKSYKTKKSTFDDTLKKLLLFKNKYLISSAIISKNDKKLDDIVDFVMKSETKAKNISISHFNSPQLSKNWNIPKEKYKISYETQTLKVSETKISIANNKTNSIAMFVLLENINDAIFIKWGSYELEINAKRKPRFIINASGGTGHTFSTIDFDINKWFFVKIHVLENTVYCQIHNSEQHENFEYGYKDTQSPQNISIEVSTKESISFDKVYIGRD